MIFGNIMKINLFLLKIDKKELTNDKIYDILISEKMGGVGMEQKSFVHYVTKICVDVLFYGGILACCAVPWIVKWWVCRDAYHQLPAAAYPLTGILLASGLCAVYILFQLKKLFRTLLGGDPFVQANISCFRKMAVAAMLIAVIYAGKCIWSFTFPSAIVVVVFVIASLFCLTLKDVFKQAVFYKQEHDFTI